MPAAKLATLLADLDRHIRAIDVTERALTQLRDDTVLERHGTAIHFAIDFAEVHAFGYRASRAWLVQELPDDDQSALQVRGQLSLSYLFSDLFPSLLLLPPYVIEFNEYIDGLRAKVQVAATEVMTRRLALERTLRSRLIQPQVSELVRRYQPQSEMAPADSRLIAEFALANFKEAYAWLSLTDSVEAADRMLGVLRRNKVTAFSARFAEMTDDGDHWIEQRAEVLHSLITRERHGRSYQSFVDGLACGYVEAFNRRNADTNQRLVLITHSPPMHGAVAAALKRDDLPSTSYYLRDLNYVLGRLAHSTSGEGVSLARLDDSLERVRRLGEIRQRIEETQRLCESLGSEASERVLERAEDLLRDARAIGPELRQMLDRSENTNLIVGEGHGGLWEAASRGGSDTTNPTRVARFVMDLVSRRQDDVLREIRRQSDSLSHRIDAKGTQLADRSRDLYYIMRIGTHSADAVRAISSLKKKAKETVLASLPGEPPLEFALRHPETRRVARAFERLKGKATKETAHQFRESLLQLISLKQQQVVEGHFLIAYVLAALDDWKEALDWLDRGLQKSGDSVKENYPLALLRCVILRRLWRTDLALSACRDALLIWTDDAALLRELAVITWQQSRQRHGLLSSSPAFPDDAIEIARRAERRARSTHLRAQTLNTLAYLLAERGGPEDVQQARHCLDQLARVLPRSKWGGRFNDTAAFVTFLRVKQSPLLDERRMLLETAMRFSDRALEDAGLIAEERQLVLEHRQTILALRDEI